ncbi:hypothetical protein A7C91_10560 [Thermococcus piezophilus]|uniref:Uncharacterized protein n=1 Tax=Thermococcus piezophilus TaxID=1712654 RepID=A0A172WJP7_9EURY|nr:hypothetical protein A7C91_10560 [Thermococcus piezophilus]
MEPFQIHAIIQISTLLSALIGILYAKKPQPKDAPYLHLHCRYPANHRHRLHALHNQSPLFTRSARTLRLHLPPPYGLKRQGFLARKITRNRHKRLAMIAVLLLTLQILLAVYSFLL